MSLQHEEDSRHYKVVVNVERQSSIWLADREPPQGWIEAGVEGKKSQFLAHIEEVRTDLRPLSPRLQMDEKKDERK